MEMHAYLYDYLPTAQRIMGDMLDFAVNTCEQDIEKFYGLFLMSDVSLQFQNGNPTYIAGKTGCELAKEVIAESGMRPLTNEDEMYLDKSPEYWAGWVLAYYQWKSGKSFRLINDNGLDIEKIIALYHPLHEADLDKFASVADRIITETVNSSVSPLKKARERCGLTQEDLSRISGVSLRMIRAYEQKAQDIAKANFSTIERLQSVLHADFSEL